MRQKPGKPSVASSKTTTKLRRMLLLPLRSGSKAARTMEGGKDLQVSIHFPVAAAAGDSDFKLILRAPSFKAWGTFWDGYDGSPAHKVDQEADEITTCKESRLFEGVVINVE